MKRPTTVWLSLSRAQLAVLLCAFVVLAPVGYVAADELTHSATAGVTYVTNSDVEVTLGDGRDIPAVPFDDDNTWNVSDLRVSGADAEVEVDDQTFNDDPVSLTNVDVSDELTVERTDLEREVTVEDGDANVLQVEDYEVENGESDLAYDSDDGLTVTLTGLEDTGVAAVDADNGEALDSTSASNGEATFDLPAGQREIELETAPADLEVRNEANPDELIDNATLRARLFSDDDVVIEREVTDGKVSLDGVPKDEELIVTVKEENADYTYRRILLDSAVETEEIYLLPTDEPSAEVEFQLADETGRFDSEDTKLFVEKPITRDGDTEYRTISGDRVGADGAFPTILVDSERYRLRVENDDGEQRVLGSYTVQGAEATEIPIGEVEFDSNVEEGAAMESNIRDAPEDAGYDHEVRIQYIDPEQKTETLNISVEDGEGNELRPETSEDLDGGTGYVETYPIENESFDADEDTAIVTGEADRGDLETESFESTVGDVPDAFPDAPIDSQVLELMGMVSIVAIIGLLVIINPPMAALVGTGYAGLLTLLGIVPIPMPAVALAGVVSILATAGTDRGVFR